MIDYEFAIVEYCGHWYRTFDNISIHDKIVQYLGVVIIFQTENDYIVIKNRYSDELGKGTITDLLRMKLFAVGKTLHDLPMYYRTNKRHPGIIPTLGYRDNGDLFEYFPQPGIQ